MKSNNFNTQKPNIRKREMNRNDQLLQAKLISMKSNLDTNAPQSFHQTYYAGKTAKIEADKNSKIQNENKILLQKLNRIASRNTNTVSGTHSFNFNSRQTTLNGFTRKNKQNQIQLENLQLLQRIQNQKPTFRIRSGQKNPLNSTQ